jgi:hypothetical protein
MTPLPRSVKARPDAEARRIHKLLAKARARAERPVPATDGRLPDFDDPRNLIPTASVRSSLAFERERVAAEKPKGAKP